METNIEILIKIWPYLEMKSALKSFNKPMITLIKIITINF